jgi:hypothetical protein
MSAWLSFFGGYAQGANEQIDEQRKREDQYIQDRMKMAAATRLEKQKEAEKQRKELQDTYGTLASNPVFQKASTPQQIALMADPVARKAFESQYEVLRDNTNIDNIIEANMERLKGYKSVSDYITQITTTKPRPVDEQTMAAFDAPKQAFGARVGSGREQLTQNAARFGMKPEEALGWEQGAAEQPSMVGLATLKSGASAPTDPKALLENAQAQWTLARDSGDPKKIAEAEANLSKVYADIGRITPDTKKDVDSQISEAIIGMANSKKGSPEYKQWSDLKLRLEESKRHGIPERERAGGDGSSRGVTVNQSLALAKTYAARAVAAEYGDRATGTGTLLVPQPDGSFALEYGRWNKETQNKLRAAYDKALSRYYSSKPSLSQGDREAMLGLGVDLPSAPAGGTTPITLTMSDLNEIYEAQKNDPNPKDFLTIMALYSKDKRYKVVK